MEQALFIAKKVAGNLIMPVGAVLLLWLTGLLALAGWRRSGRWLVALAGVLLLLLSLPFTGQVLLMPLESRAGGYAQAKELARRGVKTVVVLSGSQRLGLLTPADRAAGTTTVRLLEGLRLWRALPGSKLLLSGGPVMGSRAIAGDMAALARSLGMPASALLLEARSQDTVDQARALVARLGKQPFALVTSAAHMPRSLMLLERKGLKPIAAPADFHTRSPLVTYSHFLPQARGLASSEKALHEYAGILWLRLKWLWQGMWGRGEKKAKGEHG